MIATTGDDVSEALWIALVGVAGTLLSGLGATYLANRAAERQRLEMRKHELEDAARLAILEVLVSARRWIESADGPAMLIASRTSVEDIDVYITEQWANPTDMKPMMENREALDRAAMHAKLLISGQRGAGRTGGPARARTYVGADRGR